MQENALFPLNHQKINKDTKIYRHNSRSKTSSSSTEVAPPKKPPRTFAHDIYMTTKRGQQQKTNFTSNESNYERKTSLTPEEINALYAKPIKKSKNLKLETLESENAKVGSQVSLSEPKMEKNTTFTLGDIFSPKDFLTLVKRSKPKRNSSTSQLKMKKYRHNFTYQGYCQPQPSPITTSRRRKLKNFTSAIQGLKNEKFNFSCANPINRDSTNCVSFASFCMQSYRLYIKTYKI